MVQAQQAVQGLSVLAFILSIVAIILSLSGNNSSATDEQSSETDDLYNEIQDLHAIIANQTETIGGYEARIADLEYYTSGTVASNIDQVVLEQTSIEVMAAWDITQKNIRDGAIDKTCTEDFKWEWLALNNSLNVVEGREEFKGWLDGIVDGVLYQQTTFDLSGVWNGNSASGLIYVDWGFQLYKAWENGTWTKTYGDVVIYFDKGVTAIGTNSYHANTVEWNAMLQHSGDSAVISE